VNSWFLNNDSFKLVPVPHTCTFNIQFGTGTLAVPVSTNITVTFSFVPTGTFILHTGCHKQIAHPSLSPTVPYTPIQSRFLTGNSWFPHNYNFKLVPVPYTCTCRTIPVPVYLFLYLYSLFDNSTGVSRMAYPYLTLTSMRNTILPFSLSTNHSHIFRFEQIESNKRIGFYGKKQMIDQSLTL
jgi:hypothetical protein